MGLLLSTNTAHLLRTVVEADGVLDLWPGASAGSIIMAVKAQFAEGDNLYRPFWTGLASPPWESGYFYPTGAVVVYNGVLYSRAAGGSGTTSPDLDPAWAGLVESPDTWSATSGNNTFQAYNVNADPQISMGGSTRNMLFGGSPGWTANAWHWHVFSWTRTGSSPANHAMNWAVRPNAIGSSVAAATGSGASAWVDAFAPKAIGFGAERSTSGRNLSNSTNTTAGSIAEIAVLNYALTDAAVIGRLGRMPLPAAVGPASVRAYWPLRSSLRSVVGAGVANLVWNGPTSPSAADHPTSPAWPGDDGADLPALIEEHDIG